MTQLAPALRPADPNNLMPCYVINGAIVEAIIYVDCGACATRVRDTQYPGMVVAFPVSWPHGSNCYYRKVEKEQGK